MKGAGCGEPAPSFRPAETAVQLKELPFWAGPQGTSGLESGYRSPGLACRVPSSPDFREPVREAQAQYRLPTKARQSLSQHRPQIHMERSLVLSCQLSVGRQGGVAIHPEVRGNRYDSAIRGTPRALVPLPSQAANTTPGHLVRWPLDPWDLSLYSTPCPTRQVQPSLARAPQRPG
jgi:hypothetical protein